LSANQGQVNTNYFNGSPMSSWLWSPMAIKGLGAGLHEDLFQINEAHALVTEGFPIEL